MTSRPFLQTVAVFLFSCCLCASVSGRAPISAGELDIAIERIATADNNADRSAHYADLIASLGPEHALSADARLRGAWAAWLLASNDTERASLLAVSTTLNDVRARMLLGAFRMLPSLRKQWAAADRAHTALLLDGKLPPAEASGKRLRPRDIFGLNAYDAPFSADQWHDPDGFVGRWTTSGLTVDLVAYPAGNFLGLIRTSPTAPGRRAIGLKLESGLRLIGRDIEGRLAAGVLTLEIDGRPHRLQRTPVGYTYFTRRPPRARVLLDATTGLRNFRHANGEPGAWTVLADGSIEIDPSKGSLFSRGAWNDHRLYLEFRHAYNSESVSPRRGNSGLYVFNSYELQLIDTFAQPPTETSEGAIYHIAVPRVSASAPPLEWQSLELNFRAPRFDASGTKIANARMTVWLNGIMIHNDVEVPHPTGGSPAGGREQRDAQGPQPFMLQNHGGLLQFRNIWVAPEMETP